MVKLHKAKHYNLMFLILDAHMQLKDLHLYLIKVLFVCLRILFF